MTFLSDVVEPKNLETARKLKAFLSRPKCVYYHMRNGMMIKSIWSVEQ